MNQTLLAIAGNLGLVVMIVLMLAAPVSVFLFWRWFRKIDAQRKADEDRMREENDLFRKRLSSRLRL